MVLKTTENAIIGVNDHLLPKGGRRWVTREPAVFTSQKILVLYHCHDSQNMVPTIAIWPAPAI